MKETLLIFKTVIAVALISLGLVGWWFIYNSHIKPKPPTVYATLIDKPSKDELNDLLNDITSDLPRSDEPSYYSKAILRSIHLTFINPSKQTTEKLFGNIQKQNIWQTKDGHNNSIAEFCYNQYELSINDGVYTVIGDEDKPTLSVSLGWYKLGDCRIEYIRHLVAKGVIDD